jgi:hypothetical protein
MATNDTAGAFQVGQTVRWTSGAGGHQMTKQGEVVAVVEPDRTPIEAFPPDFNPGRYRVMFDGMRAWSRPEVSYVVKVWVAARKAKARLYWPRTKDLEVVTDA